MKSGLISVIAIAAILLGMASLSASVSKAAGGQQATMAATTEMGMGQQQTALTATTENGIPKSVTAADWNQAFGVATMAMGSSGSDTIQVELSGLVSGGVYTLWWVNMMPSMAMGPLGEPPANEFKADTQGNASVTATAPSQNNYQTLFVVYHADGKTHGKDPGKMGTDSFSQLEGVFPGPGGMMPPMMGTATPMATETAGMMGNGVTKTTIFNVTDEDGVPPAVDKAAWTKAIGLAAMSMGSSGSDTIVVKLGRLVPKGVYTLWWVNMQPSMTMGPVSNPPANEFKADANGNGRATFTVPSQNDYQALVVVYHADGMTHGENPGTMGCTSFSQLSGPFPGPGAMSMGSSMEPASTMVPTTAK